MSGQLGNFLVQILLHALYTYPHFRAGYEAGVNTTNVNSDGPELLHQLGAQPVEQLLPAVSITGTDLFTGVPYRLWMKKYGSAPISQIDMNGWGRFDSWSRLTVQKDRTKWPSYEKNGTAEYIAVSRFMFLSVPGVEGYLITSLQNLENVLGIKEENGYHVPVFFNQSSAGANFKSLSSGFMWTISQVEDGYYTFTNEAYLDDSLIVDEAEYQFPLLRLDENQGGRYAQGGNKRIEVLFKIQLAEGDLNGKFMDFEYIQTPDQAAMMVKQVLMNQARSYVNNHPNITVVENFKATKAYTDTYTYTFSRSLKIFAKLTFKAAVPLMVEKSLEAGFEVTFADGYTSTLTKTTTFEVGTTITLLPRSSAYAVGILNVAENVERKFRARMECTMETKRVTAYNYELINRPVPAEMIQQYLKDNKVEGKVLAVRGNVVVFETEGIVKGSFEVFTSSKVDPGPGPTSKR